MGLEIEPDCWSGSATVFGKWRSELFDAAYGGGPREHYAYLDEVEQWQPNDPRHSDPLMVLLMHEDNAGRIEHNDLMAVRVRLLEVAPKLGRWQRAAAERFALGLLTARERGEPVVFR
jgi:hypothetical protein